MSQKIFSTLVIFSFTCTVKKKMKHIFVIVVVVVICLSVCARSSTASSSSKQNILTTISINHIDTPQTIISVLPSDDNTVKIEFTSQSSSVECPIHSKINTDVDEPSYALFDDYIISMFTWLFGLYKPVLFFFWESTK